MALKHLASVTLVALCLLPVAGCGHRSGNGPEFSNGSSDGGLNPFHRRSNPNVAAIGVNSYLWRATLDTLAFMPLASADPYGGVVITDWYTNPDQPNERFKATVYILDTRLRADGLNVTIFKQAKDASGAWVDASTSPQTEADIENSILTRARQLRLSNIR